MLHAPRSDPAIGAAPHLALPVAAFPLSGVPGCWLARASPIDTAAAPTPVDGPCRPQCPLLPARPGSVWTDDNSEQARLAATTPFWGDAHRGSDYRRKISK